MSDGSEADWSGLQLVSEKSDTAECSMDAHKLCIQDQTGHDNV